MSRKELFLKIVSIVVVVTFFWTNCVWAGGMQEMGYEIRVDKLAAQSQIEDAILGAQLMYTGDVALETLIIKSVSTNKDIYLNVDKLREDYIKKVEGIQLKDKDKIGWLVFSDNRYTDDEVPYSHRSRYEDYKAYYVFTGNGIFFRYTPVTDKGDRLEVDDSFNRALRDNGRLEGEGDRIELEVNGTIRRFYREKYRIVEQNLSFINLCLEESLGVEVVAIGKGTENIAAGEVMVKPISDREEYERYQRRNDSGSAHYGLTSLMGLPMADTVAEKVRQVQDVINSFLGSVEGAEFSGYTADHLHCTMSSMTRTRDDGPYTLADIAGLNFERLKDIIRHASAFNISFSGVLINNKGEVLIMGKGEGSLKTFRQRLITEAGFQGRVYDQNEDVHVMIGYIKGYVNLTSRYREALGRALSAKLEELGYNLGSQRIDSIKLVHYGHRSMRRILASADLRFGEDIPVGMDLVKDLVGEPSTNPADFMRAIDRVAQPLEPDLYRLMREAEISIPASRFVRTEEEITEGLIRGMFGDGDSGAKNVYMKVVSSSRKAMHKKDVGGVERIEVVRGINGDVDVARTKENLRGGFGKIISQVTVRAGISAGEIEGVLICEEVEHNADDEYFIGYLWDPAFGPYLAIGRGGSGIEEKQKGRIVYIPVGVIREDELITQAGIWLEQAGVPSDLHPAYINMMCNLIKVIRIFEERYPGRKVEEFELNPIVAAGDRFVALDARMVTGIKREKEEIRRDLNSLFKSSDLKVVLCGASSTPGKPGTTIAENLLLRSHGLRKENIYPINPKASDKGESIFGRPYFASVEGIDDRIDLVFIAVASKQLENVIEEIIRKADAQKRQQEARDEGVTPITIVLISGGMAEAGEVGKNLETGILGMIREAQGNGLKINVVGPNCVGVYVSGYNGIFLSEGYLKMPDFGKENNKIAIVSKSGARLCFLVDRLLSRLNEKETGIAAAFSVGNTMDLSEADYVNAIVDNCPEVEVIALYLEGFSEGKGQDLCRAIRKAREGGKRVVVYLAGRTEKGAQATRSHTANLASPYDRAVSALRTAGAEIADTPVDLENGIGRIVFKDDGFTIPQIEGQRTIVRGNGNVAGVSTAGFVAVEWSDTVLAEGLKWATFSSELTKRLSELLPPIIGRIKKDEIPNPIDTTPAITDKQYVECIETLLGADEIDAVIVSIPPFAPILKSDKWATTEDRTDYSILTVIKKIIELHQRYPQKPIVVCMETSSVAKYKNYFDMFNKANIPVFSYDYQIVLSLKCEDAHGSHIVQEADGTASEEHMFSFGLNERGELSDIDTIPTEAEPQTIIDRFRDMLRDAVPMVVQEHKGQGILMVTDQVEVVRNLRSSMYRQGRAPLAVYVVENGVRKIKVDAKVFSDIRLLYEEIEHEFSESIARIVPGSNPSVSDVVATVKSVRNFLKLPTSEQDRLLGILDSDNLLDPDKEYQALLQRLRRIKGLTADELIASVVRYVLRTKLYEHMRDELGLSEALAVSVRDLEPRMDDALAVFNEISKAKEGTDLVEKVKERDELSIKVVKTFSGLRIKGLERLGDRLARIISALVKVASRRDRLALELERVKTDQRYCIILDRGRRTGEMEEDIRRIQEYKTTTGEQLFEVVSTLSEAQAKGFTGRNIIHLVDPGDIRDEGNILYLPMPYLRSSLYMAAMVVVAGGDIKSVNKLVMELLFDLYPGLADLTPVEQALLFTEPWSSVILPRIQSVIAEINNVRMALDKIEEAA